MKGWAWPHGSCQAPPAPPPSPELHLPRGHRETGGPLKREGTELNRVKTILTITPPHLSVFIVITLQFSHKGSIKSFLLSLLCVSPLCTWHFVELHKNGAAKMSKLLLHHSHSLLSTVLFSCYLNMPVFISAHTLVHALKSTRVWHDHPAN